MTITQKPCFFYIIIINKANIITTISICKVSINYSKLYVWVRACEQNSITKIFKYIS